MTGAEAVFYARWTVAGLTQEELRKRLGLATTAPISGWENNHRKPKPESMDAVCEACGVIGTLSGGKWTIKIRH
ncbi:MAG TPA: helix-turn-helix transcriptional regulator [Thermoguttaceae bacterium]|nr:helix-turn-helix transcriptional regulator [Thermoguttaceae bacterium]